MRSFIAIALLLGSLIPLAAAAQESSLTTGLAKSHVDITTDFGGESVYVFGVKNQPGDVVVVLEGPRKDMTVRRKSQVLGAWMNRQSVTFRNMPNFYGFAASEDIESVAPENVLKQHEMGTDNLRIDIRNAERISASDRAAFTEALFRNKRAQQLYPDQRGHLEFLSRDFFKATFFLPANVPVGDYTVKSFFLRNGQVFDVKTDTIRVAQVGLSSQINSFSKSQSFIYGVLCVALAIFSGLLSGRLRRQV